MKNPNTKEDVKRQMNAFLPKAKEELEDLKVAMEDLQKSQTELAEYFCEDPTGFKIEECFKSLGSFCSKFKKVNDCCHGNLTPRLTPLPSYHFRPSTTIRPAVNRKLKLR